MDIVLADELPKGAAVKTYEEALEMIADAIADEDARHSMHKVGAINGMARMVASIFGVDAFDVYSTARFIFEQR